MGCSCSTPIYPEAAQPKPSEKPRKVKPVGRNVASSSSNSIQPRPPARSSVVNRLCTAVCDADANQRRTADDSNSRAPPTPRTADHPQAATTSAFSSNPATLVPQTPPAFNGTSTLEDEDHSAAALRRVSGSQGLSSISRFEYVPLAVHPRPELTTHNSDRRVRASEAPRRHSKDRHAKEICLALNGSAGGPGQTQLHRSLLPTSATLRCQSWIDSIDCGQVLGPLLDPNDVAGQKKREARWALIHPSGAVKRL